MGRHPLLPAARKRLSPSLQQRDKRTFPTLLWAAVAAQKNRYSFTLVLK